MTPPPVPLAEVLAELPVVQQLKEVKMPNVLPEDTSRAEAIFAEWVREGTPPFDDADWMNPEDKAPFINSIAQAIAVAREAAEQERDSLLDAAVYLCPDTGYGYLWAIGESKRGSGGDYYDAVADLFAKIAKD